jgi:hypothetical protein
MYPKSAMNVECCCPDTCTTEKIVAEYLTDVARVILEPLQVELSDALDVILSVLVEFLEVDSEVAVLPVSIICDMLAIVAMCLRSAA